VCLAGCLPHCPHPHLLAAHCCLARCLPACLLPPACWLLVVGCRAPSPPTSSSSLPSSTLCYRPLDSSLVRQSCVSTVATFQASRSTPRGERPTSEGTLKCVVDNRFNKSIPFDRCSPLFTHPHRSPDHADALDLPIPQRQERVPLPPAKEPPKDRLDPGVPKVCVEAGSRGEKREGAMGAGSVWGLWKLMSRMHKKGITEEVAKKRSRKNVKVQVRRRGLGWTARV